MDEYLTVAQYAALCNRDRSVIVRLVQSGRLPALKMGNQWLIKAGTEYPADNRVKSGKYKNWRKK